MLKNKRLQAFKHAINGIKLLIYDETHPKFHLIVAILVLGFAWYFDLQVWEWCLILLCIGGVFSLEAMNSSIENLTDLVTEEYHPLAKKAKDIAAGSVLIFSIITAIIGLLIFVPRVLEL